MGGGGVVVGVVCCEVVGFFFLIVLGEGCFGGGSILWKEVISFLFLYFIVRSFWKGFIILIMVGFLMFLILIEILLFGSNLLKFMLGF